MEVWTVDLNPGEQDVNNFHVGNAPGEDFRSVFVRSPNGSSPLTTRISLVEVHHGKMVQEKENSEATLLVFELRFQSKLQERRYQSVTVTLEFFDRGKNKRHPVVVKLAPDRMHWLDKTTYERTTKYGASLDIKASGPVVSGGPSVHWDAELTKHPKFKARLTGMPGSSKGQSRENQVTWSMEENLDEAAGIPSFLQTSVLLKRSHSGPFYATLRVKSEVDIRSSLKRSLRIASDEDKVIDPVTFTPGKAQVKNSSVTGINENDLLHMEKLPINKYFKINNSEEDHLNPPASEIFPASATAPAAMVTTGTTVQKELLNPTAPIETADGSVNKDYLPNSVALKPVPTPRTINSIALIPGTRSRAAELALNSVLRAAEASKVASKAAQAAAEAAEAAQETLGAAEAVLAAAEEKQA